MEKEYLQTSELIEATKLGRETLRFYENKGLIQNVPRTEAGYRLYPKHTIDTISFIKNAQNAGFTLNEIKEIIDLQHSSLATCGTINPRLTEKLAVIENEIKMLKQKHSLLKNMSATCQTQEESTPCSVITNTSCC
jgi:MerR family mercuric resistance operon transcriptional regulator